ncbi:beta-ribofuranosylaminobenzene 5'-phosphate synthase family protein [Halomarina oriensis]|uniref:Beta-ribofuranosylaminobenzene 5'-phosphate synthase n=1 Tax=Halomarina oriensis TaxID=671145 RepID=A0A6B0GJF1_9EURY|nr:beta-ribofuranosylaminobenzene 5'-phosphate synthase family protein [Halomarina oriensis]MWG35046.1 GHMP kinase [Halomarina oriensis]
MVRVETGARLHVGFTNLSLAHERLYGGVGLALDEPHVVVEATRAEAVDADPVLRDATRAACEALGVPGARVRLVEGLPRHVGLGSGTQHALATLGAVARAYDREPRIRERAPELGRGGRSGVGVATFETGGAVVDAGHPTERFTTTPPARGEWTVPPVVSRHPVPDDWRVLLVVPEGEGKSGSSEDDSMRAVVERADPAIADDLSALLVRQLLPALAAGDRERFGHAVGEFGRLNGAWYADEQGGVYRPPVGELVATLGDEPSVTGVGQSSWGPTVYGVTDRANADAAHEAGERALDAAGVEGAVRVVRGRNEGATVR